MQMLKQMWAKSFVVDNFLSMNFTSNALTEASTLTGLTIGKSTNTSDITLNSDISVSGAVTVYGSTIDLHSDITSSGAGDITISIS